MMRATLWVVLGCLPAVAQIQVTRNVVLNPFVDSSGSGGFFDRSGLLAELNRGFGSVGGELAWNTKVGGFFEIYRWDSSAALTLLLGNEMMGNDRNDISFNPRSARWEESLVFSYNAGSLIWQIGGVHQCKHDIDNSDPIDSDVPEVESVSKRVIILSGVSGGLLVPEITLAGGLSLTANVRADWYPASSEYRFPGNTIGKNWAEIVGNTSAGLRVQYRIGESASAYILSWATYSLPGESLISDVNYRWEVGLRLNGRVGSFHFYGARERYFDDLSGPLPQASSALFLGLRVGHKLFL